MTSGRRPANLGVGLVERPPTIHVQGAVSGVEVGEVTLHGAFKLVKMLSLIEFHLAWATVSSGRTMAN